MDIDLWFFYPDSRQRAVTEVCERLRQECTDRGWRFQPRTIHRIRNDHGRPRELIDPEDAAALYRRMHRARVAVFIVGKAFVQSDPGRAQIRERDLLLADIFARHKAFLARVDLGRFRAQCAAELESFGNWCATVECEDERDPRCLPLHIFDASRDHPSLKTVEGRQQFAEMYGKGRRRTDRGGMQWIRGARHGRDTLHVAGYELTRGFHWDVSPAGRARTVRISTADEVWEVRRGGHINIFPDGYVRGSRTAKRVWPSRLSRSTPSVV